MDTRPLLGAWTSYDERTIGILAMEIGERRGVLTVQVKNWDVTLGAAFGSRADPTVACGFTAHFRMTDRTVLLAAYLNRRLLVVDAYTRFTNSEQSNMFHRDHLYLR
jgi:hypothetical protein